MGNIYYVVLLLECFGFSEKALVRFVFSLCERENSLNLIGPFFALFLNVGVPQGYVIGGLISSPQILS